MIRRCAKRRRNDHFLTGDLIRPGVDVVDAFEAFQPRTLSASHQPRRMCELSDRIAVALSICKHATKPISVRSPAELQANNGSRGN